MRQYQRLRHKVRNIDANDAAFGLFSALSHGPPLELRSIINNIIYILIQNGHVSMVGQHQATEKGKHDFIGLRRSRPWPLCSFMKRPHASERGARQRGALLRRPLDTAAHTVYY